MKERIPLGDMALGPGREIFRMDLACVTLPPVREPKTQSQRWQTSTSAGGDNLKIKKYIHE